MEESLKKVRQFHDAMGVETPEALALPDLSELDALLLADVSVEMQQMAARLHSLAQEKRTGELGKVFLRLQLMQEELAEFAEALALGNRPGALRELVDLRYVVDGSALTFGLAPFFQPAFNAVHQANMTKLDDDGKPCRDEAGRIVKGPNYRPPQMDEILQKPE